MDENTGRFRFTHKKSMQTTHPTKVHTARPSATVSALEIGRRTGGRGSLSSDTGMPTLTVPSLTTAVPAASSIEKTQAPEYKDSSARLADIFSSTYSTTASGGTENAGSRRGEESGAAGRRVGRRGPTVRIVRIVPSARGANSSRARDAGV